MLVVMSVLKKKTAGKGWMIQRVLAAIQWILNVKGGLSVSRIAERMKTTKRCLGDGQEAVDFEWMYGGVVEER